MGSRSHRIRWTGISTYTSTRPELVIAVREDISSIVSFATTCNTKHKTITAISSLFISQLIKKNRKQSKQKVRIEKQ